jgi:glutamate/tyrosine decarboxylase-like PLP-dependent enzyme
MSDGPGFSPPPTERPDTLDPADPSELRRLAHRMIDDAFDDLASLRERPAWRPMPPEHEARFGSPLPRAGAGAVQAYEAYRRDVAPYRMGNDHPRFWAYYMGNGNLVGALAEYLAAMDASNLGGGATGAARVERQVVRWGTEMLGLPADSSGLLTSGASVANLIGLAVARHVTVGEDVRRDGVAAARGRLVTYASTEVHSCHQRALELMGMGSRSLHKIPVDGSFRIDLEALEAQVAADRADGAVPMAVVANAGSINTGSVDDMRALARLCRREGVWFHVDAAIGAPVKLAPTKAHLVDGLDMADSVALDLHKWMHMPFEAGMLVVRDAAAHRAAFTLTPEYLQRTARGLAGDAAWFSDYGPQLSRDFKALKVWMTLQAYGADLFGRLVERNIEQAHALAGVVGAWPDAEVAAPVVLDIVCLRLRPEGVPDAALDAFHEELVLRIQESGEAVVSTTTVHGRRCLRVAICNHRTSDADVERFARVLRSTAEALAGDPEAWRA